MRMPSSRLDIIQDTLNADSKKLKDWLEAIAVLTAEHHQDIVLYTKSASNVGFHITSNPDLNMDFEQRFIEDNPEMTLKQWKESLTNLIHAYNEDYYLYTVSIKPVEFYLSPIK